MAKSSKSLLREVERLNAPDEGGTAPWRRWGPYISERSWGTVREDYSANGDAWNFLPHDLARSKAYRWGEDGIAGICDRYQLLVFALALWNGRDPILKERMFGLNGSEANHGEDVKEYYFYLDNTPTHSYMKLLYKYPQAEFPYWRLDRRKSPPRPARLGVRVPRYRRLRRRSLFRRLHRICESRPRRHLHSHRSLQSRSRGSHAASPAASVVSQYLGVERFAGARADHPSRRHARKVLSSSRPIRPARTRSPIFNSNTRYHSRARTARRVPSFSSRTTRRMARAFSAPATRVVSHL